MNKVVVVFALSCILALILINVYLYIRGKIEIKKEQEKQKEQEKEYERKQKIDKETIKNIDKITTGNMSNGFDTGVELLHQYAQKRK